MAIGNGKWEINKDERDEGDEEEIQTCPHIFASPPPRIPASFSTCVYNDASPQLENILGRQLRLMQPVVFDILGERS